MIRNKAKNQRPGALSAISRAFCLVALTILMLPGCSQQSLSQSTPSSPLAKKAPYTIHILVEEMLARTTQIHSALVRGDLPAARFESRWLSNNAFELVAASNAYTSEFRAVTQGMAETKDVNAFAQKLGELFALCGSCHLEMNAVIDGKKSDVKGIEIARDTMRGHGWATKNMFSGIYRPSDARWMRGTADLSTSIMDVQSIDDSMNQVNLSDAEARVRSLAKDAMLAPRDQRARYYGKIMATCEGCHSTMRPMCKSDPSASTQEQDCFSIY